MALCLECEEREAVISGGIMPICAPCAAEMSTRPPPQDPTEPRVFRELVKGQLGLFGQTGEKRGRR